MKELQMGENIRSAEPLVKQVLVADRSKSSIEIIPSSTNSSIDQPIPLSFPSLLVNPRLRHVTADIETARLKPTRRELRDSDSEGSKRRRRRLENATLSGNPFVSQPTRIDLYPGPYPVSITFPAPPPQGFSTSEVTAVVTSEIDDNTSAQLGKFSMSLRGVRKSVKHISEGGRSLEVVQIVEREFDEWLSSGKVWRMDDLMKGSSTRLVDGTLNEDGFPSITEISNTPANLCWEIRNAYIRFLVHCVARHWHIVSFSKTDPSGLRITYLLRPFIISKPALNSATNTPPETTDWDSTSVVSISEASDHQAPSDSECDWVKIQDDALESIPSDRESSAADDADVDSVVSSIASLRMASERSRIENRSQRNSSNHSSPSRSPDRRVREYRPDLRKNRRKRRSGTVWRPPRQSFVEWLQAD